MPDFSLDALLTPPPQSDLSGGILRDVFGPIWSFVVEGGGGGGGEGVLGGVVNEMFHILGYCMALSLSFIIFVMLLLAILHTSNTGKLLGKHMDEIWTPVRISASMAMVYPLPALGGYSALQAIIILGVGMSISSANMLYSRVQDHLVNFGTVMPLANAQPDPSIMAAMVRGSACLAAINDKGFIEGESFNVQQSEDVIRIQYGSSSPGICGEVVAMCSGSAASASQSAEEVQFDSDVLGKITSWLSIGNDNDSPEKKMCRIVGGAYAQAAQIINGQIPAIVTSGKPVEPGEAQAILQAAYNAYTQHYNSEYQSFYATYLSNTKSDFQNMRDKAVLDGWIMAGAWYWNMQAQSLSMVRYGHILPTTYPLSPGRIARFEEDVRPGIAKAEAILNRGADGVPGMEIAARGWMDIDESGDSRAAAAKIFSKLSLDTGTAWKLFLNNYQNDPLRSLTSFGQTILGISTAAFGVQKASFLLKIFGGSIGDKISSILDGVAPLIFLMLLCGFSLAYILPALPFFYWMGAISGWLAGVIESMIAAPMWAVMHALPDSDSGFFGRWSIQGWQLFVNILLRPIILVFVLILSMIGLYFLVKLTIAGYLTTNAGIINSTSSISGIFNFVFGSLTLSFFVIFIAQRWHELIYASADRIMAWMSFGVHPLGQVQGYAESLSGHMKTLVQQSTTAVAQSSVKLPKPAVKQGGGEKDKPGSS